MNKKFWATAFTLTGTIIGAGILGIPYVFAQSGFLIGFFWLIVLGTIMIFINLSLGEITLRTRGRHQLSGYAKKYLGKWGQYIMFFAMIFGIYSALSAYLLGEGESLSRLLPGNINPIFLGIAFWLIMTLLLREGLKGLKKIETWGVLAIIIIIISIFIKFFPRIQPSNLLSFNISSFTIPIGVVLFALLGFTSIPELRQEIKGKEKLTIYRGGLDQQYIPLPSDIEPPYTVVMVYGRWTAEIIGFIVSGITLILLLIYLFEGKLYRPVMGRVWKATIGRLKFKTTSWWDKDNQI